MKVLKAVQGGYVVELAGERKRISEDEYNAAVESGAVQAEEIKVQISVDSEEVQQAINEAVAQAKAEFDGKVILDQAEFDELNEKAEAADTLTTKVKELEDKALEDAEAAKLEIDTLTTKVKELEAKKPKTQ